MLYEVITLPDNMGIWGAISVGLLAGNLIGFFTEYFTSDTYKPTQRLSGTSKTGPATVVIGGRITSYNVCYTKLLRNRKI